MTGRDLIIYILDNKLEDVDLFEDGNIPGFLTETQAADKFEVGLSTIRVWFDLGFLDGMQIRNKLYIKADCPRPSDSLVLKKFHI